MFRLEMYVDAVFQFFFFLSGLTVKKETFPNLFSQHQPLSAPH